MNSADPIAELHATCPAGHLSSLARLRRADDGDDDGDGDGAGDGVGDVAESEEMSDDAT